MEKGFLQKRLFFFEWSTVKMFVLYNVPKQGGKFCLIFFERKNIWQKTLNFFFIGGLFYITLVEI